ncbi:MAG: exopolysaccharide biosynthesis protein [Methyloceanibacter sp.]
MEASQGSATRSDPPSEGNAYGCQAASAGTNTGAAPNGKRTSVLLREFLERQTGPRITLGALRDALGDRGFGVLIFIFALPNLVPVNVPLLSAVLGLPLVLLAAQLSIGRHEPWFPDWLTSRSFPREGFSVVVFRSLPSLERIEKLLRPRLTGLLSWTGERLIGIALLVLAIVLTLPIPFGNWLPAFAIAIIGLAVAEKDGVAVLIGLATGFASLIIAGAVVVGLVKAGLLLLARLTG